MVGINQLHEPATLHLRNERQEAGKKQEQIYMYKNQQNGLIKIE